MSKFKICPHCGEKNSPDALDCLNCDEDISGVPPTDELQETAKKFSESAAKNSLVRVCSECGTENPPNSRKCLKCREDISDVIPTPSAVSSQTNAPMTQIAPKTELLVQATGFILRSLDGKINFNIDRQNIIVGREHELKNYLTEKTFVSRRHCQFTLENGELFVEDLNSANSTYVNNKKIFHKTRLSKGDEVGLGGALFNDSRQDKAAYFLVG